MYGIPQLQALVDMQYEAAAEHGGHGLAGIIVDLRDNPGACAAVSCCLPLVVDCRSRVLGDGGSTRQLCSWLAGIVVDLRDTPGACSFQMAGFNASMTSYSKEMLAS
jgi:hypothetical protein